MLGAGYFKRIYDARTRAQIGLVGFGPDYLSPSTLIQPNFACASLAERRPENASYFCDPLLARQVDRALASQGAGNVQHHLQWFTLLDQLWVR